MMATTSNKFGGGYTTPIIHFSDSYSLTDFRSDESWDNIKVSFGDIIETIDHITTISLPNTNGRSRQIRHKSPIYISRDGLIATMVPSFATTDYEALCAISNHLNSFLFALNMGGLYLAPFNSKTITHVKKKDEIIEQVSAGGDEYSETTLSRSLHRYQVPHFYNTPIIDSQCVPKMISACAKLGQSYSAGKTVIELLDLRPHEGLIALDAFSSYTLHDWTVSVLLGWAFTEILIGKAWNKFIINRIDIHESGRKARLEDFRIYTSAVKTELLYSHSIVRIELYNSLNKLRHARNSIIHKASPVFQSDAVLIFQTIPTMIEILSGVECKYNNPGWSWSGGWVNK